MTEEEIKSYEILYKKIMFVDKYRFLKPHWIKFHNYIKKLEKENEELRQNYDIATTEIEELKEQKEIDMYLIGDSISKEIVKRDYIPKDKIRDKLDEIMSYTFTSIEERHQQNYAYDRIRELLEEE